MTTQYLKPTEVAATFRVSVDTVYRWIKEKRIPAENMGTGRRATWRIPADAIHPQVPLAPVDRDNLKRYV